MVTIAVVCPTFNSAEFIEKTLSTVVEQTRLPNELIIVDDGSSDSTVETVRRFLAARGANIEWQVVCNAHRGPGAARNAGVFAAKSEWIAFLDSDDLWEGGKLEQVEFAINSHPEANFLCHDELRIESGGRTSRLEYGRRYRSDRPLPPQLYFANMFSTSAVTCRRDLLVGYGGFDETLMSAQDYELWLRLSESIRPLFIRETLGRYVERRGNITSGNMLRRMKNELKIALKHRCFVSFSWFLFRVGRILLSFARQYVKAALAA